MSADKGEQAQGRADQGQAAKQLTMANIIKKKRGVMKKATIQIDGEVAVEILELRAQITIAEQFDRRHNEDDTAPKLQAKLDQLIEDSKDTEITFVFKALGRLVYDELVSDPDNAPSDEQKKEGAQFNPDTFPPALVAAAAVDPEISLEEAVEIFGDSEWNGAELQKLFFAALEVNTETGDIPLSKGGSGVTASSLLSSLMQQNAESPTPSS